MLNPFARQGNPQTLVVGMIGTKMGDRLLQIGCAHGGRLGAVAAKVGLSGRTVVVVPDESAASRVRKGAAQAGVLVEIEVSPPTRLPVDNDSFDVVIVDDTGAPGIAVASSLKAEDRDLMVREVRRVLRPGGRVVFVGHTPPTGLRAMIPGSLDVPAFVASGGATTALSGQGFKSPRTLAAREGLVFVEGIKPR